MAAQPVTSNEPGAAPEPLPEKKAKSKLSLIIGLLALILFAGAFFGVRALKAKGHAKKGPVKVEVGTVVPLDEFLINTADPSGDHYLKTTVAIGLVKGISDEDFKNKVPIARDAIVMVLAAKTVAQLRTTDGKLALKAELRDKVNQALGDKSVADVYIESFATQ
ncbi:MAG TPA: flagellar basal body-associated FliL family protein [Capsulimonadaceae bacterium]|nr:flagellar basal body-associated FliL family protein [Capsulimonadaceae bacterium]